MGRSPCCAKEGLNRGAWTAIEDKILTDYIKLHGEGSWRNLPKRAGLKRCGKSCRLRWLNYLRPDIKRGNITADEEELIIRLHKLLGNRWSLIAGRLPGRTDNEIKNYWNSNLSRRLQDHNQTGKKNTKQSDKSRDRKLTSFMNLNPTLHPQNQDPTRVVRTKAVKCTKVFINPPPPAPPAQPPTKLSYTDGLPDNPPDLQLQTMDFGDATGEFVGSPAICGQLSSETKSKTIIKDGDQLSLASLEEPFLFSEEMMEDWRSALALDASLVECWLGLDLDSETNSPQTLL